MVATNSQIPAQNEISDAGNLLYDTPLKDPKEDRLGRKEFARFLADAILKMNADEGFVFALNGPWGSGKSTVINFVLHFIEETNKNKTPILIVRFNPWWFSGREQLLHQFFGQFRATLGGKGVAEPLHKLGERLDLFANILAPLALVPGVGQVAGAAKDILKSSGKGTKAVAEAMNKDAHQLRDTIDTMLREQQARILVVIDDIDRLPAEEIRQLFQVVKAVADFPKTIYLLSFDRVVVTSALDTLQKSTGENYVEKIVQCPFDLPQPDRVSLRRLLFEQLDEIMKETPKELIDQVEFGNMYLDGIDSFIKTPRDVKRYVNILRPAYPVLVGNVHPVDFLGIQALRLFVPEIYQFASSNKTELAGPTRDYSGARDRSEERKKIFDPVFEKTSEDKREAVKEIMGKLFPRWSTVYGGSGYGADWLSGWRKEKRVCSPDFFDRYFQATIPQWEITAVEMRALLDIAGNEKEFGNELIRLSNEHRPDHTTRLRNFLELMEDHTSSDIPQEHIEPIITAIFRVGDQLLKEEDAQGEMFHFGNDMRLDRITYQLLKRLPSQQERFELLQQIFTRAEAIDLMSGFLVSLSQEHGINSKRKPDRPESDRTVSTEHIVLLEKLNLEKIRARATEQSLHNSQGFGSLLYRFAKLGSEREAKDYVANLIKSDEGLCDYLKGFLSVNYSQSVEDSVERKVWRVHQENIEKFVMVSLDELLSRCQEIIKKAPEWLDDRRRLAVETFIEEMTSPKDEWGRRKRD